MLTYYWFKEVIIEFVWLFPPDHLGELLFNIIASILYGIIGICIIPLDIVCLPFYLIYYLLSKIKIN